MKSSFLAARLALLVYFIVPGLVYGLFTSRLPALKAQTGALESDVGLVLLMFGAGSVAGLLAARRLLARFGARTVLLAALLGQMSGLALEAFASSLPLLFALSGVTGLFVGLTDVTMNAQGLALEKRFSHPVMGFFHAGYCAGGGAGSLLGALFAAAGLGVAVNYLVPALVMTPVILWSLRHVQPEAKRLDASESPRARWPLPLVLCGLLAFLAFESEGACGDWGGLLLINEKGAAEGTAAAVYAVFTFCALASRLASDSLRRRFSAPALLSSGAVLGIAGFLLIVASTSPALALAGVAVAGLGLGPAAPLIYSLAGRLPGVTSALASSAVSILGYTGLLLCPPCFGVIARHWHYSAIFSTVTGLLVLLLAGVLLLAVLMKQQSVR